MWLKVTFTHFDFLGCGNVLFTGQEVVLQCCQKMYRIEIAEIKCHTHSSMKTTQFVGRKLGLSSHNNVQIVTSEICHFITVQSKYALGGNCLTVKLATLRLQCFGIFPQLHVSFEGQSKYDLLVLVVGGEMSSIQTQIFRSNKTYDNIKHRSGHNQLYVHCAYFESKGGQSM